MIIEMLLCREVNACSGMRVGLQGQVKVKIGHDLTIRVIGIEIVKVNARIE